MNLYEALFLTDAALASKDWPALEKHIHDLLERRGAEILYTEKWPDRRLAYSVKGCKKGTYYLVYFNAEPTAIVEARRDVQLSERILRALFICERGLDEEMERRKNNEIGAPPVDLFPDHRFAYEGRGRFRRHSGPGGRGEYRGGGRAESRAGASVAARGHAADDRSAGRDRESSAGAPPAAGS